LRVTNGGSHFTPEAYPGSWAPSDPRMHCPTALRWPGEAAQETVAFLRDKKDLSAADAYALASVAVDFRVGEAVDAVQMVYGMIPKRIFKQNQDYWSKR
jgi:hypothetical protein